jgi:hypothetical protein
MMKRVVFAGTLLVLALAMAAPAFATDYRSTSCGRNCPAARPHYDSQEVVRATRDIDYSRTINTTSVIPVSRKVRTINHLVIRKNTIRKVGVIRHNHTIIEKEIHYKRRVPAPPMVVNFVTQKYRTVHRPAMIDYEPTLYPRRKLLRVRG